MSINWTIIGQIMAFIVFVMFCMRYVWPPILAAMEERQKKIADGLAAADRASHDLELAQKEAVDRLSEAKKEGCSWSRTDGFGLHRPPPYKPHLR